MMTMCPSDLDLTKVKETWKRQLHESHLVEASKSQQINISSPYQYWFNDAPKRRPAHSPFFRKTEAPNSSVALFRNCALTDVSRLSGCCIQYQWDLSTLATTKKSCRP